MRINNVALSLLLVFSSGNALFAAEQPKASAEEKQLLSEIAQDGLAEVKLGNLAEQNAKENSVRGFAKHMVHDHSQANEKLKEAALKDGIELPKNVSSKQTVKFGALRKLSGNAFDEKYTAEMLEGHKKAVAAITRETEIGSGACKQWAAETLPTIKDHLQMAESLKSKVQ